MGSESIWKRDIPHPAFLQLEPEVSLWRYTDLGKFVWTLSRCSLYLSRGDLLGDNFEGSVPRRDHERMVDLVVDAPEVKKLNLSRQQAKQQFVP